MARYQLRDSRNTKIAEGSFLSSHEARAWPLEQDVDPGWTLLRCDGDRWVAVRRDEVGRRDAQAS